MSKKSIFTALLFCLPFSIFAQEPFQAGLGFIIGVPQNAFKDSLNNNGYGIGGHFAYNLPNTPLLVGASLSYLIYSSETWKERLIPTVPVWVDVNTTNSIFMGHLLLRLQPPAGVFRPYVDGLFGFHLFSTDTKIEDEGYDDDDDDIAGSNNSRDFTGSYGGGGGVMFRVYHTEGSEGTHDRPMSVYVDFGFRYLKGGKAEYLKKGSIRSDDNNNFTYNFSRSTTDIVIWRLGAGFGF